MAELIHLTDIKNLPLSSIQKRLWIISQQAKLNPAYNIQLAYYFEGEVNIEILTKSIQILFERQHTMFSVFKQNDGTPYINISSKPIDVGFKDFSNFPANSRRDEIVSFAGDDTRKSFDTENGPLYRLYLLKEDEQRYFFYATIHHLIFDGFSRKLFVQELSRVYNNQISGIYDASEPLSYYSYDFARQAESLLPAEKEKEMVEFWKENLKDCPPEMKFPYDYPRKKEPTGFGYKESLRISEEYTNKLRKLSVEANSSLFHTLLSVLGLLLREYTGENDICIGVPFSTRRTFQSFKIFGAMINTVAARLNIEGGNNFIRHINYTAEVLNKSITHSTLPFEKIVEAVNPQRISGINPFFQIVFSWINNLTGPMNLGGSTGNRITLSKGVSSSDITFYMWEESGRIEGEIEYNSDILKQDTIVRLKDNFIFLAQSLADNPDEALNNISILSAADRKLLSDFNNTERAVPACLLHQLFEQQAIISPAKTALITGDKGISYSELESSANQLARFLISLGVTGGDVIGICVGRSVEMVVAVLGVLKAGCCYLPIDPTFPDDRIKFIYENSGAKVLISQSSLGDKFRHFINTQIVLTDEDNEKIRNFSTEKPFLEINSQDLAYMIYTSGSTGKPKGVKVHHEAVVNFILSMSKKPGFLSTDRLLAVTTLSFDISVLELFLPISTGGMAVIARNNEVSDGQMLSKLLDLHDITVFQATPITWTLLLGNGWKGKKNLKGLCGGEAISPGLVKELMPKVESFWNMYGPTETTVWSTCFRIIDINSLILVGTPIDNTQIYILDKHNKLLPVGIVGEVCIGGLGVTKGYNNLPELTAEKFITSENGRLIYKTGDLGRFTADGNIELFGRIDKQIKLRGFRIEPGEIESLLTRLDEVKEAVVKLHKFDKNDDRLVAFLNAGTGFNLTKQEIALYLSRHLPAYMIPSFYRISDGFPRLPNGKINTKEIIFEIDEPDSEQGIDFSSFTATQKKLVDIWEKALKIQNISITDNFFNIGGNSLLAINVFSKIISEFRIDLDLRIFFDSPRIKDLAESIDISLNVNAEKNVFIKPDGESSIIITGEI